MIYGHTNKNGEKNTTSTLKNKTRGKTKLAVHALPLLVFATRLPGTVIFLIVILVLVLVAGAGFLIYYFLLKDKCFLKDKCVIRDKCVRFKNLLKNLFKGKKKEKDEQEPVAKEPEVKVEKPEPVIVEKDSAPVIEEPPAVVPKVAPAKPEVAPAVKPAAKPAKGKKVMPPLYNYSFQARRHLMDEPTLRLYNMLKNHIMKYENVSVNQTWDHEIFMTSGRALARLRFHGKTFKLYLDINAEDYPEPKFPLIDESKRRSESTTQTLLNVRGPRMMKYGLSLIDDIAAARELVVNEDYVIEDFKVESLTNEALIELGLIKSSKASF